MDHSENPVLRDVPAKESGSPLSEAESAGQVTLVETPNLGAVLSDFRSKISDALSIPSEQWPSNRRVTMRLEIGLVPLGVSATIENIDD